GLPVESPELADARTALAGLRASLGQQHLDAVRARAQEVRDRLGRLSADDRSHVEDEAAFLLAEADAALAPPPVVLGSLPPQAPAGSSGATPVAAAPSAPAAVDDHGRAEPADDRNQGRGSDDHPSGTSDDHSGSVNTGSGSSGPGPSGSSGGSDDHTAPTQHV